MVASSAATTATLSNFVLIGAGRVDVATPCRTLACATPASRHVRSTDRTDRELRTTQPRTATVAGTVDDDATRRDGVSTDELSTRPASLGSRCSCEPGRGDRHDQSSSSVVVHGLVGRRPRISTSTPHRRSPRRLRRPRRSPRTALDGDLGRPRHPRRSATSSVTETIASSTASPGDCGLGLPVGLADDADHRRRAIPSRRSRRWRPIHRRRIRRRRRDRRTGMPSASCVSERMSTRTPVRRAASRAFWPSRPIARLSWWSGTMTSACGAVVGDDHLA